MKSNEQWHLDDEGRLHKVMRAMDTSKVEWHGLPAATTRGARLADRLLNGVIVTLHVGVAAAMLGFVLVTLGYIKTPSSTPSAPQAPIEVPACGK